jgi:hypothetical protein
MIFSKALAGAFEAESHVAGPQAEKIIEQAIKSEPAES